MDYRYRDYVYNSETGSIRWAETFVKNHKSKRPGEPAGFKDQKGYLKVSGENRKQIFVHRLAWFLVYGEWPIGVIDHINRDPLDNRIENLRDVDSRANSHNRYDNFDKPPSIRKRWKGFEVRVVFEKKKFYKTLPTEEEAIDFYWNKLKELRSVKMG
jgi:hypothetical protein